MQNKPIKYIAYLESYEENGQFNDLILDALEVKDYEEINEDNILNIDFISNININILSFKISHKQFKQLESMDYSWFEITISDTVTEISAKLYNTFLFEEDNFQEIFIEDIKPFKIDNKRRIFSMDIFNESSKELIQKQIYSIVPNQVICYNVGQGNCNGVCDYRGVPLMYFDFGGGVFGNTKTYPGNYKNPKAISFCFTEIPPVILSHWDWDHMVSATKNEHKKIKDSKWIVPKQEVGISHLKFIVEMYNKGNLLVWPNKLASVNTHYIEIQKLSTVDKEDKNNNGLVVIIKTKSYKTGNTYNILLPADAHYEYINLHRYEILHGLVATHHGASNKGCLKKVPRASMHNRIAYSFGLENTYKHPKLASYGVHAKRGWNNKFKTTMGHISLGTDCKLVKMPCGTLCSLGNTQ